MGLEMLRKTAAGAAFLGMMWGASVASAFNPVAADASISHDILFESEFGKTLPPIGFVRFCGQQPEACAADSTATVLPAVMTAARWQMINEVNSYVNRKIAPVSDQDLYGQAEYWTYPVDAGDCEDYALLKQRYLERLGIPASALLMTVVLDEKKDGHAVLTLSTTEGDFVLDNRSDEIRRWHDTRYTFLKRQSRQNPRAWVALLPEKANPQPNVASKR